MHPPPCSSTSIRVNGPGTEISRLRGEICHPAVVAVTLRNLATLPKGFSSPTDLEGASSRLLHYPLR